MKVSTAVLHLAGKDPQKVYQLGGKVYTSLTSNPSVFIQSEPTLLELNTETIKLDTLLKSKDGSKQKNQAILDQTDVVYTILKSLAAYTNKIANGDKSIILLSGFDCNNEPTTHDIPGKAIIKRLEDGNTSCSVKIFMEALADADRYKVEINTTSNANDPASWKTVLDFGSINRLELKDLPRGQEIFLRVSGGNTWGWGIASESASFIPR